MAKKKNRNQPPLLEELDQLEIQAEGYEADAKTMRTSLYNTLANLMRFKINANNSVMNVRTFNAFCIEQKIKGVKKTSVQYPAVIRAVWREHGAAKIDSALRYGRVLQKAEAEGVSPVKLPEWLQKVGGIEVVLQTNFGERNGNKNNDEINAYKNMLQNNTPSLLQLPTDTDLPEGMGLILYRKNPGQDAELIKVADGNIIKEDALNGYLTKIGKSMRDNASPVPALKIINAYRKYGDIALVNNTSDSAHIKILTLAKNGNPPEGGYYEISGPAVKTIPVGVFWYSLNELGENDVGIYIQDFLGHVSDTKIVNFSLNGNELTISIMNGGEYTFDYNSIDAERIKLKEIYDFEDETTIATIEIPPLNDELSSAVNAGLKIHQRPE